MLIITTKQVNVLCLLPKVYAFCKYNHDREKSSSRRGILHLLSKPKTEDCMTEIGMWRDQYEYYNLSQQEIIQEILPLNEQFEHVLHFHLVVFTQHLKEVSCTALMSLLRKNASNQKANSHSGWWGDIHYFYITSILHRPLGKNEVGRF